MCLQVAGQHSETAKLSTWQVVERVYTKEGIAGFWRGALPRMSSVALWGCCMATAYEALKRVCIIDDTIAQ
jgi:solute carrier family 25, member 44